MSLPKVTVLMPVYNSEKYLREAIESILGQTFTDFEFLIILDDNPTDSSKDIIKSYSDPRIRLIENEENIGLIESLNKGLRLAKGEYIARMDADDIAFSDRLERQVAFLEQNHSVALFGGAVEVINSSGESICTRSYPVRDGQIKDALPRYCCFAHPTIVMRKEAFHIVGGYRKAIRHAEDYDLWLRIAEHYELANLPEPVLYYRIHPGQVCTNNLKQQIISTLGAQTATKIRRETGLDPLDEVDSVTIDLLSKLGVQDEIIQKALMGGYIWWAEEMGSIGAKTTMLQFLTEARKIAYSHESYNLKQVLANCYFQCARICYCQKAYNIGLRFLIEAIRLDPAILMRAAKHLFRFLQPHNASNHYG